MGGEHRQPVGVLVSLGLYDVWMDHLKCWEFSNRIVS